MGHSVRDIKIWYILHKLLTKVEGLLPLKIKKHTFEERKRRYLNPSSQSFFLYLLMSAFGAHHICIKQRPNVHELPVWKKTIAGSKKF